MPLKLLHNRVRRPFCGGYLLDKWQGLEKFVDGYRPEEWVASLVEARNPEPIDGEGLSRLMFDDGTVLFLKDLIEKDPVGFLGKKHVEKHGANPALLVKVLDSYTRLLIQVHPNKQKAEELFQSPYGKTEAWYVLGGRSVNGEEPYVFLGFKPGVSKEKWQALFEEQDVKGMEEALNKITVKPGDVFLVQGGVPHAAGSGLFFLEIQEPTDYTIRTERKNMAGDPLTDMQLHQGLNFDKMFDCFDYEGFTQNEILQKWYLKPEVLSESIDGRELSLINSTHTSVFSMTKLEIRGRYKQSTGKSFCVAVVVGGAGKLIWNNNSEMKVQQGDEFFIPTGIEVMEWKVDAGKQLDIVFCYPPT